MPIAADELKGDAMGKPGMWTVDELFEALNGFEVVLREANLAENSVKTYVDRSRYFVRWLAGDYEPTGPQGTAR